MKKVVSSLFLLAVALGAMAQPFNAAYWTPPQGAVYRGSDPLYSEPFYTNTMPSNTTYYVLQNASDTIYSDAVSGADAVKGPGLFTPLHSTIYQATGSRAAGKSVTNQIYTATAQYYGTFYGNVGVNATGMLFVSKGGNDSTGKRNNPSLVFQTINAASTAAQSGDTIVIENGVYNENHINRPNKTLTFNFQGASIHYEPAANDTQSLGIIDDRDGACTNYIIGKPNIYYSTGTNTNSFAISTGTFTDDEQYFIWSFGSSNSPGAFYLTNAASVLSADLNDVTYTCFNTDQVNSGIQRAAFNIKDCASCIIHYNRLLDGAPAICTLTETVGGVTKQYLLTTNIDPSGPLPIILDPSTEKGCVWNNGRTVIEGNFVDGFGYCGVWSQQDRALTTEQDLYWIVKGDQFSKIYTSALGFAGLSNLVSWFNITRLVCTNGFGGPNAVTPIDIEGGKNYFVGGKVQSVYSHFAVAVQGSNPSTGDASYSELFYNCQRTSGDANAGWLYVATNVGGGQIVKCHFNSLEWQVDGPAATPGGMIFNNGGDLELSGGPIRSVTNGVVLWCTNAGTTTVTGLTIDNRNAQSTVNYPAVIGGGATVSFNNCTLFAKSAGFSIFSQAAAQAATLAKTATNQPANANVTITSF